jgi:hypothetical protein
MKFAYGETPRSKRCGEFVVEGSTTVLAVPAGKLVNVSQFVDERSVEYWTWQLQSSATSTVN